MIESSFLESRIEVGLVFGEEKAYSEIEVCANGRCFSGPIKVLILFCFSYVINNFSSV